MLKTNTVNTIAFLSICISFWNALYIFIILYINNVIYKITTLVQCKLIDRTIALKTTRKMELIKSEALIDKTYKTIEKNVKKK